MIYSYRCGPAIEVLRTNEGLVYARQIRFFQSTSEIWRDLFDGQGRPPREPPVSPVRRRRRL